jgi:hypothetical protein
MVYDNDGIGGDEGETSGSGLGDGDASSGKDCDGSCGDGSSSLNDEVGVYDSVGLSRNHTDSDIDRKENIEGDLSSHDPRASSQVTTAHVSITRADNVALVSAEIWRSGEVKLATVVAFVVVEAEVVGT